MNPMDSRSFPHSMNKNTNVAFLIFSGIILLLLSSGCIKKPIPIFYYTLGDSGHSMAARNTSLPTILTGPIQLASFLDQGQLITQNSSYSVNIEEQHRWAGDLQEMLATALITNLRLELGSERIYNFPVAEESAYLQLPMHFTHFEKNSDGKALITVHWKILSTDGKSILFQKTSTIQTTPEHDNFESLAKALTIALTKLSAEIAEEISLLPAH